MKVYVTGVAGFIGSTLAMRLLKDGVEVSGMDNLNAYYDVRLKERRLERLKTFPGFSFEKMDLAESDRIKKSITSFKPEAIVHLAAQAGVRYSLENPQAYVDSNITGTLNILEACRLHPVKHLIYASTSSVYGIAENMPFSEKNHTSHQLSFYAATKKANEAMAHSYSSLFEIPTTGLRFFTVYGPWGRPDMALFLFTKNILEGKPINVFNHGHHKRDFTYVDDIVESIVRLIPKPPKLNEEWDALHPDPSFSRSPYRIFNIGNSTSVELIDYIHAIEKALGKKAEMNLLPLQKGDVPNTLADCSALEKWTGFRPNTPVETGISNFVKWYREYYQV